MTIAIPIHQLSEANIPYLEECLASVGNQSTKPKTIVFCTEEVATVIKKAKIKVSTVIMDVNGYTNAVNNIADTVEDEFLMVLEFDDVLNKDYLKSVEEHIGAYPDVDMFLPIVHEISTENDFLALKNNIVWSYGQMAQMGYFSLDETKKNLNFSLSGAVYRTKVLRELRLKHMIPIYFNTEFLLRFLRHGRIAYVVPKVGIKHRHGRAGSYFEAIADAYDTPTRAAIIKSVKHEYMFDQDRKIDFE